jgi:aminoglycoside 3-N-acetyltransferase
LICLIPKKLFIRRLLAYLFGNLDTIVGQKARKGVSRKVLKPLIRTLSNKLFHQPPSLVFGTYRRKLEKKIYRTKFTESELIQKLKQMGLKPGITLFVHSSWNEFYNYQGTSLGLIQALLKELGTEGTLAMPAFPLVQDPTEVFDVEKTPSGAGLLTELFRRMDGVKRSINLEHSVCALGKYADYLVSEHHLSLTSWDEKSPYFKLHKLDAIIVSLGVGHNLKTTTALHCAESILRSEILYFKNIFPESVTYRYKDASGKEGTHTFLKRVGKIRQKKIADLLNRKIMLDDQISNLKISTVPARYLIDQAVALGRQGITMYVKPKPDKKLFRPIDK